MKFMSILLSEGRKEDLKKKYSSKFQEYPDTLDFVLGISDLIDSNHKYTDFVLKNLHPNSSTDEVEDAVELVKDFEQYSNRLQIKDINQYRSFQHLEDTLENVIQDLKGKQEDRDASKNIDRVFENDRFLVIKPKTEQASCKYGSRTKWCVTSKGTGHFQRYTSGDQELYFIIDKKNSTDNYYSKVAVHVDSSGKFTYWDSQDNRLDIKEIKILEYAFPELMQSIKDDYNSSSNSRSEKFVREVFNNYSSGENASIRNYLSSNLTLDVHVEGFENVDEMEGHAMAQVAIQLISDSKNSLIDSYDIYINYGPKGSENIRTYLRFEGIDPSDEQDYVDLGLESLNLEVTFIRQESPANTAREIRNYLANRVLSQIKTNSELIQKVKGEGTFWKPDRANYGYTFGKNKGLIKKLVDYLDAGTIGTKGDFLEYVGKVKSKVENGKKVYDRNIRGYFSSFFASAKMAGILNYRKIGKDYFLVKGPNFEAFKSGQLRAL